MEQTSAAEGEARARVLVRVATPLTLFGLAFAIRSLPWQSVLTPDHVLFVGTDAYYHMRRVLFGLVNFPAALDFDRYINFPHGARPIWPAFFDASLAFALRPFFDGSDAAAVERVVVWVPPLLGASCVLALHRLARRHFDRPIAIAAATALSLLSGHFWYSQIGFLDHHAAVALLSTLLLASCMSLLTELERAGEGRIAAAPVVAVGLCSAVGLLLWPGMLLHLALAQAGLLLFLGMQPTREDAGRCAFALASANALALALVIAFGGDADWPQFGAFSPVVLSHFQPWLLAAMTLTMSLCWWIWRGGRGQSRAARLAQGLAVAAVIGITSIVVFPDLASGALDGWRWLGKSEQFQASVAESRALFDVGGHFDVRIAETRLSRFVYLFPLALLALGWRYGRGEEGPGALVLIPWALGLGIVTLFQKRFFNSFSVTLALLMGWSLVHAFRTLQGRFARGTATRVGLQAAFLAIALLLIAPVYSAYQQPLRDNLRLLRGEAPERRVAGPDLRTLVRTADWLRANTPPTSGYFDDRQPEYGVLSLWGNGHVIEYVGRRATVTDSFGDDIGEANFRASLAFFNSNDASAGDELLDRLGVRYLVTESLTRGRLGKRSPRNLMERLFEADAAGLSRYRLVFEQKSEAGSPGSGAERGPGELKVFEHVKGALVSGRAPAGSRVQARLGYTTNLDRRGVFRSSTRTGADGVYELRLPYATRGEAPALLVEDAYELRIGDEAQTSRVVVSEQAVREGLAVPGPNAATLKTHDPVQERAQ